jgi:hypothetical protein
MSLPQSVFSSFILPLTLGVLGFTNKRLISPLPTGLSDSATTAALDRLQPSGQRSIVSGQKKWMQRGMWSIPAYAPF